MVRLCHTAACSVLMLGSMAFGETEQPASHDLSGYQLREGDLVFLGDQGPQSEAVRAATASPYTHCGLVFEDGGVLRVLEAVQPVRVTSLESFHQRSAPGTFHAMRLKSPPEPLDYQRAMTWAKSQLGVDYDMAFRWSDDQIYCSELVWKTYAKAGVILCAPRPFRSFKLEAEPVRELIAQRYGSLDKLPLDEPAVSPGDLAGSKLLVEVPRLDASD